MLTVIDMTTGGVVFRSRGMTATGMSHEQEQGDDRHLSLALQEVALQDLRHAKMLPELAHCVVDEFLARFD